MIRVFSRHEAPKIESCSCLFVLRLSNSVIAYNHINELYAVILIEYCKQSAYNYIIFYKLQKRQLNDFNDFKHSHVKSLKNVKIVFL